MRSSPCATAPDMSAHDSSEKVDEKDASALASAHSATLSDHEAEYEEYLALKVRAQLFCFAVRS